MASKTGGMLQDQNLNIRFNEASVGWKTNVSKAPSKRGAALAGRTPLGDLSNSLKPSINRATRKQSSTFFSPFIEKEVVTSDIALDATKKKNTSKASLKQQPAGRKALFDIADEGFLHNHEECIKAEAQLIEDIDMNRWVQMSDLYDGEQKSTLQTPSASFRKEVSKEAVMAEYLMEEVCWKYVSHDNSDSPPIIPELVPVPSLSDSDDSDSPPISPEWSCDDPDWRMGDWIDSDHDDLRIYFDHDDWRIDFEEICCV